VCTSPWIVLDSNDIVFSCFCTMEIHDPQSSLMPTSNSSIDNLTGIISTSFPSQWGRQRSQRCASV
jgi:hypothetical protein